MNPNRDSLINFLVEYYVSSLVYKVLLENENIPSNLKNDKYYREVKMQISLEPLINEINIRINDNMPLKEAENIIKEVLSSKEALIIDQIQTVINQNLATGIMQR